MYMNYCISYWNSFLGYYCSKLLSWIYIFVSAYSVVIFFVFYLYILYSFIINIYHVVAACDLFDNYDLIQITL